MLRKIADRTVHRKAYGIAPFIRLTNHNSSYTRTVPADMTAGTETVLRTPAISPVRFVRDLFYYSRARAQREAAAARGFLPGKSVHMFENARRTAEKVKERVSDLSFFLYNYDVV